MIRRKKNTWYKNRDLMARNTAHCVCLVLDLSVYFESVSGSNGTNTGLPDFGKKKPLVNFFQGIGGRKHIIKFWLITLVDLSDCLSSCACVT